MVDMSYYKTGIATWLACPNREISGSCYKDHLIFNALTEIVQIFMGIGLSK